jgi:hypothetical protein
MTAASLCAGASRRCAKLGSAVARCASVIARSREACSRALRPEDRRESRKHSNPNPAHLSWRLNTSRRCALLGFFLLALAQTAIAQVTVPVGGSLSIPDGGAVNLGCLDLNVQGNVAIVGAGQIGASTLSIAATGVVQGGSGTITVGGNWINLGSFAAGSGTVILTHGCGIDPVQLSGNTAFNNLTLMSTTGGTFVIPAGHGITVNGTLTLQGLPGSPIQIVSSSALTAFIVLGAGGQLVSSNATVSPSVQIGAGGAAPWLPAILFLLLD